MKFKNQLGFNMKKLSIKFLFVLIALLSTALFPQQKSLFVNYGSEANREEGDPNSYQIFFIKIPKSVSEQLYLKIFDIDCGKDLDQSWGEWNTKTSFAFYGGAGVFSNEGNLIPAGHLVEPFSGTLIKDMVASWNGLLDNYWFPLSNFTPQQGELIDDYYYFKLVVKGLEGNDANVFDVAVSNSISENLPVEGLQIFSYAPTIRLLIHQKAVQLKFMSPGNDSVIVLHNFDGDGTGLLLQTPFRSGIVLSSSENGQWFKQTVTLKPYELNKKCAIQFGPGGKIINDVAFYVTDSKNNPIPIELPVEVPGENTRPVINHHEQYLPDCVSVELNGCSSFDKENDPIEFFWKFNDGKIDNGCKVIRQFAGPGTYDVELIARDGSGQIENSVITNFTVTINDQPVAKAGNNITAAPNETVNFNASASYDNDGTIKLYSWNFGDGKEGLGKTITHTYTLPGKYSVMLTVQDNSISPCNFNKDSLLVWVNARPTAVPGENRTIAVNEKIAFDASNSSDKDGEIVNYEWDFGDGSRSTRAKAEHEFNKPGSYDVSLKVTDNAAVSNSSAIAKLKIIVNAPPIANAGKDAYLAISQTDLFDAFQSSDPDGTIISYQWDFGDGATTSGIKNEHSYAKPGTYEVKLTVTDNSGTLTSTTSVVKTVRVNAPPVAIGGDDIYSTKREINFDASKSTDSDGQIIKYSWDFGDGSSSNEIKTLHTYKTPGIFKVKLTVTDNSGLSNALTSTEFQVKINAIPVADAGPDILIAQNETAKFSASRSVDPDGKINEYQWTVDGKPFSDQMNAEYIFSKPGKYTVELTVKDESGHPEALDSDQLTVTVNDRPKAKAGIDQQCAPNEELTFDGSHSFDNDGQIVSYQWSFSDGKYSADKAQVKRKFTEPGLYLAILTVKDNMNVSNNIGVDTASVFVNTAPVARINNIASTCDLIVNFDAATSTDNDRDKLIYSWNFGADFSKIEGEKVNNIFKKPGKYPIILTVDDQHGLSNSTAQAFSVLEINAPPAANAGQDVIACGGEVISFDASASYDPEGGQLKYYWDFGDSSTAEGQIVTKAFKKGGVYQAKLKVVDNSGLECNYGIATKIITVAESPVAIAGADKTVCAGSPVEFDGGKSTDSDGIVNGFFWDFGDGNTGSGEKITHVYKEPGVYKALLTITGEQVGQCDNTSTDELIVSAIESPIANYISLDSAAANENISFDASSSIAKGFSIIGYNWDFGDGASAQLQNATHSFAKPGKYTVMLTISTSSVSSCNSSFYKKQIFVNAQPVAVTEKSINGFANKPVKLRADKSSDPDGAISKYFWQFEDGTTKEGIEYSHVFEKPGVYKVELKVIDNTGLSNNSAIDTLTVNIE